MSDRLRQRNQSVPVNDTQPESTLQPPSLMIQKRLSASSRLSHRENVRSFVRPQEKALNSDQSKERKRQIMQPGKTRREKYELFLQDLPPVLTQID